MVVVRRKPIAQCHGEIEESTFVRSQFLQFVVLPNGQAFLQRKLRLRGLADFGTVADEELVLDGVVEVAGEGEDADVDAQE